MSPVIKSGDDITGSNDNSVFNYVIVILMMMQPFLGATSFNALQILIEVLLWALLIFGVAKTSLNKLDVMLLIVFLTSSVASLALNSLNTFLLNFKIFGLCIFTLIYFRKRYFNPQKLILSFALLNILYALAARHLNLWLIESAWFFDKQDAFMYSRPVAFLGSPHASTTFLALYFLMLFQSSRRYMLQITIIYACLIFSSWTAFLGLLIQIVYIWTKTIFKREINPLLFFAAGMLFSYLALEIILAFASDLEGVRFYSIEIMAPMLFDIDFYKDGFPLYPKSHDLLIALQEKSFAGVGNEMGFIKIFTEGGVVLGFLTMFAIVKRANYFTVFFFITLLHYSYFVNLPLILYCAMTFNQYLKLGVTEKSPELKFVTSPTI